jgi:hypothetical protein
LRFQRREVPGQVMIFKAAFCKKLTVKTRRFLKIRLIFHFITPAFAASFLLNAGGICAISQATWSDLRGWKESLCKGKYWW